MEAKDAGIGAAVAVLLAILGLVIIIGLILLMMWKQPGIEHSPSQETRVCVPSTAAHPGIDLQILQRAPVTQYCNFFGSGA
jgi:hypothetical protein